MCLITVEDDDQKIDEQQVSTLTSVLEEGTDLEEALHIVIENKANKSSRFDLFWKAADEILSSEMVVPDERRHGSTCCISPLCVSLRDLKSQVEQKAKEMFPHQKIDCPSEEYFRLQFTPRNENALTAARYYKRFDIKWVLQTRLLHKEHRDQHFGAKQFKYLKQMAQRFSSHATVFFLDDKASIPIGHPNTPVSATRRQRKVLGAGIGPKGLTAADHDVIPMHLTPSVSVKLSPPEDEKSWYMGEAEVILKDAIFQPSNAFRHAAEIMQRLKREEHREILFFGTDGGSDHNVSKIQVILSYVALFLESKVDALVAVRTPPNFSVINPAERLMSTLNLGLIGMSLARDILEPEEERKVCCSYYTKIHNATGNLFFTGPKLGKQRTMERSK